MYESHFGLTGTPFGLNPDPAFFFGSKGHSHALSYLKFGVYQGEGFVVVTGEIGAGKTTLVATLLSELDKEGIVAAQIVSTQLEAGDLLRSVALAFGIAPKSLSKAELIATIEAFLTLLVTENKRALLIVDEAQNLSREAVEELRMLSNFQLGNQALLQSFLVGQPELRALLTSKPMEQFRQRVIASCHLGPMDRAETQAYIEHRLHQVGWHGEPAFDSDAFDRIYHWTSGIPRRVNLLCNRLLLSAYLGNQSRIDAQAVDQVADEARGEVSEATVIDLPQTELPALDAAHAVATRTAAAAGPAAAILAAAPVRHAGPATVARVPATPQAPAPEGPLLLVAASVVEDVKMAALAQALNAQGGMGSLLRVRIGEPACFAQNDELLGRLGIAMPTVAIDACDTPGSEQVADVLKRFATLLDEQHPAAVVVGGSTDAALACALAAAKKGCRVAHVDAGRRGATAAAEDPLNGVLIDRVAEFFYPSEMPAYVSLIREGIDDAKVCQAGDLMVDATRLAVAQLPPAHAVLQRHLPRTVAAALRRGHGLVSLEGALLYAPREAIAEMLSKLQSLAAETPLLWPMSRAVSEQLLVLGLRDLAAHDRITLIEPLGLSDTLSLMTGASFVVADSRDVQVQAAVAGVKCLLLDPRKPDLLAVSMLPRLQDDDAARPIAAHLARCLGPVNA